MLKIIDMHGEENYKKVYEIFTKWVRNSLDFRMRRGLRTSISRR